MIGDVMVVRLNGQKSVGMFGSVSMNKNKIKSVCMDSFKNRKNIILAMVFGILLSATLVIGDKVQADVLIVFSDISMYITIMVIGVLIAVLLMFLMCFLPLGIRRLKRWEKINRFCQKTAGSKWFFIISWLFLLVCWIPCLLAAYPGIVSYDCGAQFMWGRLGSNIYYDHHPILHTELISIFLKIGRKFWGSNDIGILLYTVVQMIVLSGAFSVFVYYLRKWKVPVIVVLGILLGYGVLPLNAMFSVCVTKDVYFTAFFVLFIVMLTDLVIDPARFLGKKVNWILVAGSSFFMCAFRHNGIYVLVFTCLFTVICMKYFRVKVALLFGSAILLFAVYTGPFFQLIGAAHGNIGEALSVPIQQISRVAVYDQEELTEEEMRQIEAYIPNWSLYDPRISDPAKARFSTELLEGDPIQFVKLWVRLGIRHPQTYINSFLANTYGIWYPGNDNGKTHYSNRYFEYDNIYWSNSPVNIERKTKAPVMDEFYRRIGEEVSYQKIPGLGIFFNQGYCLWYLLIGIMLIISRKNYWYLLACIPLIGLYGTVLLGPVMALRYAYPFMAALPVMITGVCVKGKGKE